MQQIIYFIRKFRYFLLFILLEVLAFFFTIQHHSYQRSKFVNSANSISGNLYSQFNSINEFFKLRSENERLNEENSTLKNILEKRRIQYDTISIQQFNDNTTYFQKYEYTSGKIIKNDFTGRNNFLTLDKGTNHGVTPDLGVINSKGIIGVIKNASKNYATVLSILNNSSRVNVRLKNSDHFGTLAWDGKNYNMLQLTDIPRQASLTIGDTIITGGKSAIFPEGILVGTIENLNFTNNQFSEISIKLFNDMSAINNVQIIKNLQRNEQLELEKSISNE